MRRRITGPIVGALLLIISADTSAFGARESGYRNYDGDTFRATFRVSNVDAPEIEGKCDAERRLAQRARVFTEQFLARGGVVIKQNGVDQYGRVLATVEAGGVDLGGALVKQGLARPWKGHREAWCG